MSKERTAFKHPKCGGVIVQYMLNDVLVFECDQCGERAEEIDHLILRGLVIIRHASSSHPTSGSSPPSEASDKAT